MIVERAGSWVLDHVEFDSSCWFQIVSCSANHDLHWAGINTRKCTSWAKHPKEREWEKWVETESVEARSLIFGKGNPSSPKGNHTKKAPTAWVAREETTTFHQWKSVPKMWGDNLQSTSSSIILWAKLPHILLPGWNFWSRTPAPSMGQNITQHQNEPLIQRIRPKDLPQKDFCLPPYCCFRHSSKTTHRPAFTPPKLRPSCPTPSPSPPPTSPRHSSAHPPKALCGWVEIGLHTFQYATNEAPSKPPTSSKAKV